MKTIQEQADELIEEFSVTNEIIGLEGDVVEIGWIEKPTSIKLAIKVVEKQIEEVSNYGTFGCFGARSEELNSLLEELKSRLK